MPALATESGIVHYETYGRGRPVILLHGWLGSWTLWRDTIEILGKDFKTYALDFFGFGEASDQGADFSVNTYVELVSQFMDRLGIVKAPLIGHSMGGTVALAVARRYPEKVVKVAVIGSPVDGSSLNFFLKLSGYRFIATLTTRIPVILNSFIYFLTNYSARDGARLYEMVRQDAARVSAEAFFQSIGTLRKTNLIADLPLVTLPIMGMYGRRDIIVNPRQSKVLLRHAPHSREVWFDQSGHFPMMDEPERFHQSMLDFLHNR
ncbi:MAG: alpha/beta hydrolase [Anaerolineae bacterium]|nr:alpha/beta hydrolase [Anaerolineae bacterium]